MKILELNIYEFGGLKDRTLSLSRGLNLIEGENEAGKSTVWLFIKFMLYGLPKKGQEERIRSVSRDGHCAKGSMRVLHDGEEYLIERSFVESARSGSERVRILRCRDGADLYEGKNPGEWMLGVPKEVFETSCGIGQAQSTALGGKKSMDAIRNLLSSADEGVDISKIIEKLDRVRVTYRHKVGKGGRLSQMGEEYARLSAQHKTALETQGRLATLRGRLASDEVRIEELRRQQKELNDLLTQIGFYQILQRFDRLEGDREELRGVEEARERLKKEALRTDFLPTFSHVATLQTLAGQVEQAEERLISERERKEGLVKTNQTDDAGIQTGKRIVELGGADAVTGMIRGKKKARTGFAVGCGLSVGLGALLFFLLPVASLPIRLGALCGGAALGILFLVLCLGAGKKVGALLKELGISSAEKLETSAEAYKRAYQDHEARQKSLADVEAGILLSKSYLDESLTRLTKALVMTLPREEAAATAERGRAEALRLGEYLKEDQALSRRLELLLERIQGEEKALAGYDAESLRKQVSPGVREMNASEIERAELTRKNVGSRLEALEKSQRDRRIEEISLSANARDPLSLADEMATLEEKRRRAEAYNDSLELAIQSLEQAADAMSGSITPALSEAAGAMMGQVSRGKYGELRTGNELNPTLFGTGGLSVPGELMSGGTKDAAYLCLRIALMTQVFGGDLPPLMMDESLCQMDDGRVEQMLELLSTLCGDGLQCLLFTCHKRESEIAARRGFHHQRIAL